MLRCVKTVRRTGASAEGGDLLVAVEEQGELTMVARREQALGHADSALQVFGVDRHGLGHVAVPQDQTTHVTFEPAIHPWPPRSSRPIDPIRPRSFALGRRAPAKLTKRAKTRPWL